MEQSNTVLLKGNIYDGEIQIASRQVCNQFWCEGNVDSDGTLHYRFLCSIQTAMKARYVSQRREANSYRSLLSSSECLHQRRRAIALLQCSLRLAHEKLACVRYLNAPRLALEEFGVQYFFDISDLAG